MKQIDPTDYGLPPRIKLSKVDQKTIAIMIERKSRIIMKDYEKILHIAEKIYKRQKYDKVVLATSAPICSKTKKALELKKIFTVFLSDV
ncbi:MAG: hypothetical protein ISR83_07900 [Candidatus Marinimicrobia bacterium]|nr:hypothetical protein [Candidatus Neomarinimicrobiota bacterium]